MFQVRTSHVFSTVLRQQDVLVTFYSKTQTSCFIFTAEPYIHLVRLPARTRGISGGEYSENSDSSGAREIIKISKQAQAQYNGEW